MVSQEKRKDLEKQGYRLVGNHSAIKMCMWTGRALKAQDTCYKHKFYGIKSWQCVQMTPSMHTCSLRCQWCWRDIDFTLSKWHGPVDEPKDIVDGCIKEHTKYLMGFLGNKNIDKVRFHQALSPKHFAISLSGEPSFYPKLPELIDELNKRNITSFLVTNGTNPEMIEKLIKKPITQLYITLPAPDEETFEKVCRPLIKNGWKKIMKSLKLLPKFKCRKTIRMTLAKNINMINPKKYAKIIKDVDADFFELKAYMFVGYSRKRLNIKNMPLHKDIIDFSKKIIKNTDLKLIDQKPISRVSLLMRKDTKNRIMKF